MADDLYCKVYVVDASASSAAFDKATLKAAVEAAISAATGQNSTRRSTQAAGLLIEVFDNPQRTAPAAGAAGGDFVRWPLYLEVEPVQEPVQELLQEPLQQAMTQPAFIAALAALLKALNDSGLRTVFSCDFEDQLASALQILSRGSGPVP